MAQWLSERHPAPADIVQAGDELRADRAITIARVLNRLLIELGPGYRIDLPHAPGRLTSLRTGVRPRP